MAKKQHSLKYLSELEAENEELKKLLNSKRYRALNLTTDAFYRIISKKEKSPVQYLKKEHKTSKRVRSKIDYGRVDIVNVNFYDWEGKILFKGGAERYVYDLACLIKKLGYRPRLIQGANNDFKKKYKGIDVVGVKMPDKNMLMMSCIYNDFCKDAELVIASPLELASHIDCGVPVIGINHGINFDHSNNTWKYTAVNPFKEHHQALSNVKKCVCVDTNFINWVRTRDYNLSIKMDYIPNYYDTEIIKSVEHKKHSKIKFVYPRRIYAARGYDITLEAFKKIFDEMPNKVELHMVGQYDNEDIEKEVESMISRYPNNLYHEEYPMEEMYKAYNDADVVLVPTKYSEGTSLSCIEGMASGAAIITTVVGGLPNLVINGYNGLLVNPTADDIERASKLLIADSKLRHSLSEHGKNVAEKAFQKNGWDEKWQSVIKSVMR